MPKPPSLTGSVSPLPPMMASPTAPPVSPPAAAPPAAPQAPPAAIAPVDKVAASATTPQSATTQPVGATTTFPDKPVDPHREINEAVRTLIPDPVERAKVRLLCQQMLDHGKPMADVLLDIQDTADILASKNPEAYQNQINSLSEQAQGRSGVTDPKLRDAMAEINTIASHNGGMVPLDSGSITSLMGRAGINLNGAGASATAEVGASWSRAKISVAPWVARQVVESALAWQNNPADVHAKERFEAATKLLGDLGHDLTGVMGHLPSSSLTGAASTAGAPVAPARSSISLGGVTVTGPGSDKSGDNSDASDVPIKK